ncbi:MAG TPA: hypothetical protein VN633_25045 [Bryobacteraceae bacterium]|nr:hypothetical protein [Bryobacteraceae bacterium]
MRQLLVIAAFALLGAALGMAAVDVPVPSACTPQVNQRLAGILTLGARHNVDNVMVCGVTISPSRRTRGGRHGAHDILPVLAKFPDGSTKLIQVVVNEDLDGRVTAAKSAAVFAFGQAFFDNTGRFAAGIHDVHCSTHRGADNGWVVIDGNKTPKTCGR